MNGTHLEGHKEKRIAVLVVDSDDQHRRTITSALQADPRFEVSHAAEDAFDAAEAIRFGIPDVILLENQLPRMSGLVFLRRVMSQYPIPTVVCSAGAASGSSLARRAQELGAVAVVQKPPSSVDDPSFLKHLRETLWYAAQAPAEQRNESGIRCRDSHRQEASNPPNTSASRHRVLAIGASMGGIPAIRFLLGQLPEGMPPIVITQHMSNSLTVELARSLDSSSALTVKEAEEGDALIPGRVLIAPGGRHLAIRAHGGQYQAHTHYGAPVRFVRPSVDVLFDSVAAAAGPDAVGVILTGMGDDGARGLLEMKRAGGHTIAQDETSCAVFGMPREAIQLGAAREILSLDRIAAKLATFARPGRRRIAAA